MSWLQIRLIGNRQQVPLLEAALENLGALAISLSDAGDDPQFEPPPGATPLWEQVQISALLEKETQAQAEHFIATLGAKLGIVPKLEILPDQAWERLWLRDLKPMQFGKRLWVCPQGQRPEASDAVSVILDPGLAFGTGHHPTTALCLRWLESQALSGKRLIDYGCGSGILAIAALKLGAAQAVAVDLDPQALEATAANAARNAVRERIQIYAPDQAPEKAADHLVANILAGPLIALAPRLAALVCTGGQIALSGILEEQAEAVAEAYAPWVRWGKVEQAGEWVLLQGKRC